MAHGLISLLFLFRIAAIYLGAWRGKADAVTIVALAALCVEAAPFLPPRGAELAVPVLAAVSVLGAVLLAARAL